jgi:cation:H+ antiporter
MTTLALFFIGLAMLYLGGEGLIRGAAAIGVRFHMSPLVVGLTLVAFATSAPELAIATDAALKDLPGLAVGNVVGSNICNLALIFGIVAIIKPAQVRQAIVRRDVLVMSITTLLVPALLLDGILMRIEGILLVLSITAYVTLTVWHSRVTSESEDIESSVPLFTRSIAINLVLSAGSVTMLIYGSELFVDASVEIAMTVGVPPAIVGLSAAALGSSLPELSAAIISARHGHPEMAAGNLIGSNIFNLLLILGVTSTIRPLERGSVGPIDLLTMIAVTALALIFMLTRRRVRRAEGVALVSVYAAYMAWLYLQ